MTHTLAEILTPLLATADRQLHPDEGDFVGRAFVREQIEQFKGFSNRMLILVGPPGIGKTAFAAELVRSSLAEETPHLAHFCTLPDGDDPQLFCAGIARQVQALLGASYRLPQTFQKQVNVNVNLSVGTATEDAAITGLRIEQFNLGATHPREAFRLLVREPLRAYDAEHKEPPGGKPLVIVIDALDRAWEWDGGQSGNIVSVLAEVQDLPPWVNLICTARPGPAVQALRATAGVMVVDLTDKTHQEANRADIESYVRERLIGRLDAPARARLGELLASTPPFAAEKDPQAAFVHAVVEASQGIFLFVRRYAREWRTALAPQADTPAVDPATLLHITADGTLSLTDALDATYREILDRLHRTLDDDSADADTDVLAALAIAFAPLNLALLASFCERTPDRIAASLARLVPVLDPQGVAAAAPAYALYHRGFANYVRRSLPEGGRALDVRVARALEQGDGSDPLLREYSARHRWPHLLRGLAVTLPADEAPAQDSSAASEIQVDGDATWQEHIRQIAETTRDSATQAQLLRGLAARATDQSSAETRGGWSAAAGYLRAAEEILDDSRAMRRLARRGRLDLQGRPPPRELLELERTLIALGDAYTAVGRRIGGADAPVETGSGPAARLYGIWSAIVRLPLTIYLLLVLAKQGVRDIRLPGTLQNLGRDQDWAVARLYVQAVRAYRKARTLARAHSAETTLDEISERLGRVYRMMGAHDIATGTYEDLLARPTATVSPWQQSVWLLSLGEALLAQHRPERAIEALGNALPTFVNQRAPVLQARALSALAAAQHAQAVIAYRRGDDQLAQSLDDSAVASCGAALTAWFDVTTLRGDDLVAVDPGIAIGRIAHLLRHTAASDWATDAQRQRAEGELARITERHFAQRFEHPLLRLFRIAATVLLPAYVLVALTLAVQEGRPKPIDFPINPVVRAPLLDLSAFPNNLVAGGTTIPAVLGQTEIAQLVSAGNLQPVPSFAEAIERPESRLLAITWVALGVLWVYLAIYTIIGLLIITLTSPGRYQHRAPGRIILSADKLVLRGMVSHSVIEDALDWLQAALRGLGTGMIRGVRRVLGLKSDSDDRVRGDPERIIPLAQVERVTASDRRVFGFLLGDFSGATVRQQGSAAAVVLPGTITFYDELCDDLRGRLGDRYVAFSTEIARSISGVVFGLTLLYIVVLIVLLPVAGDALARPLPVIGYSASQLYMLIVPGLVLPLVWWFVLQPLGAARSHTAALPRLLGVAAAATLVTLVVLAEVISLTLLPIEPDLITPTLALGLLAGLLIYAPPRPLHHIIRREWRNLLAVALATLGAVGITLVCWRVGVSLAWHDARVRGRAAFDAGYVNQVCFDDPRGCPEFKQAEQAFTRMICLRPASHEGYTLRANLHYLRYDDARARADLEAALLAGTPQTPPPQPGCFGGGRPPPDDHVAVTHANLGSFTTQHALTLPHAEAMPHFTAAMHSYARALGIAPPPGDEPSCLALSQQIIGSPAEAGIITSDNALVVAQLAGTCYQRGLMRVQMLASALPAERLRVRQAAWADITAAVAQFHAVATATDAANAAKAERSIAAGWLLLGQFEPPPAAPDQRSYLLRAQDAYRRLIDAGQNDVSVYAGQAWSTILLDAWSDARPPLEQAIVADPHNPTYPAMLGYISWLDSTRYASPGRSRPSLAYTRAISQAVEYYGHALDLTTTDRARVFATRSTLLYSLRDTPRHEEYGEEDYGVWMMRAINDVDQALLAADAEEIPPEEQVGYRYWRGRLSFSLALTWQRKLRGLHTWQELIPLYARAADDFAQALVDDGNMERRRGYTEHWLPWARYMLNNAANMQITEAAVRAADYERARTALALVDPRIDGVSQRTWDRLSGPRPEYSIAHGLISLALDRPEDFVNVLTASNDPLESYEHAITDIETGSYVPEGMKAEIYRRALADLDDLLERGKLGPGPRGDAQAARTMLLYRLNGAPAVAPEIPFEPNVTGEPVPLPPVDAE
jgi:tetratricopeptide (TPR) repeat protein